jgi:hypothetical protein
MLADDRFSSAMLKTTMPPLRNPDVADKAPNDPTLTVYDEEHAVTYMRLLDAEAESADWQEVCRIVLHIDPEHYPHRARRAFDSHLARAKWAARVGYRQLLERGWPRRA